ncbi:cholecystokinin receptor-like [Ornithodoros turicata]|uniref:cholecystokinin receptor-like n=1 Tax=Ornithodoros turicata TaxID=34597 RepID=UPI003138B23C
MLPNFPHADDAQPADHSRLAEARANHWNTSWTNISDEDYPPMEVFGNEVQTFLIVLYTLTAVLALGGNITVVVVLVLGKRSSRELRLFLVNLALSDITMAVFSIPFTYTDFMLGRWVFEPLFCPAVLFMQHLSVIVSVYTLTAIGVDR